MVRKTKKWNFVFDIKPSEDTYKNTKIETQIFNIIHKLNLQNLENQNIKVTGL